MKQSGKVDKMEKIEAKRKFYEEHRWSSLQYRLSHPSSDKKIELDALWGFPSPEGIVPKKLHNIALRLIPLYNDTDKRFWISFWVGLLSPLGYVVLIVVLCQIFPPKNVPHINLDGIDELLFWPVFMFSVGFLFYHALEYYCRHIFFKIDEIYFAKTGKTGEQIEAEIIEELVDGSQGAFIPEYIREQKKELKKQRYKAYVAYAFYGLVIPFKKQRYIKVPVED